MQMIKLKGVLPMLRKKSLLNFLCSKDYFVCTLKMVKVVQPMKTMVDCLKVVQVQRISSANCLEIVTVQLKIQNYWGQRSRKRSVEYLFND